jgi:tRNA threonylcarbamoyladenosine biosynthesis protein TsaB
LYLDTSEPEAVLAVYAVPSLRLPELDARVGQGGANGDVAISKIKEVRWLAHRELSATLSDKYTELMKEADVTSGNLNGVVAFVGPGSFTGLRIGISFANGLAYGLGIPVFETKEKGSFNLTEPKKLALPFYGAEPNITKPKK